MNIPVDIKPPKKVEKIWGYELWIHNDSDYCGKLLVFTKQGNKFSMHYHLKKKETWYVQEGGFDFHWIDVENGKRKRKIIKEGDSVLIERGQPHQLIALADNSTIVEVSTEHFDEDSYRIYRDSPNDLID
jgi:mannose-6-phosphate isomerase-like protein (cupin superfamily)